MKSSWVEQLLMFFCIFLMVALFISVAVEQKTVKEYQRAYAECSNNFVQLQSGSYMNTWNFTPNITEKVIK
jgi:hypothetical protein